MQGDSREQLNKTCNDYLPRCEDSVSPNSRLSSSLLTSKGLLTLSLVYSLFPCMFAEDTNSGSGATEYFVEMAWHQRSNISSIDGSHKGSWLDLIASY